MSQNKTRIVIAGGGTAGWSAAAFLSKHLSQSAKITLIESSEIPTVGVGEATVPLMVTFNDLLGIDESEFMRSVDGTFKLGIEFEGWRGDRSSYIHPFGRPGRDPWPCNFFHYWLASRPKDISDYEKYCAETMASRKERFGIVPNRGLIYAYHFDAGKYAQFLQSYSKKRGVFHVDDYIERANLQEDGSIDSLTLRSGTAVKGDLFVDCTGFKALLMEKSLKTGFDDWSHWLPCDSAISAPTKSTESPKPYTRSIAHGSGWRWRIPLQSRMGNGFVYSSQYISDEEARDEFLGCIEAPIKEPKLNRFKAGIRKKQWNKNCVAVGLSGGFLEPLESTSIYFIQRNIVRLIQLFEGSKISEKAIEEFNSQSRQEMEGVRDFVILHYKVNGRNDTPFWRYCRDMNVPVELKKRIELFRESGRIFTKGNELFNDFGWAQIMMGQGVMPKYYHPFVDEMSSDDLDQFLIRTEQSVSKMVNSLPSHEEFINRFCPSSYTS